MMKPEGWLGSHPWVHVSSRALLRPERNLSLDLSSQSGLLGFRNGNTLDEGTGSAAVGSMALGTIF